MDRTRSLTSALKTLRVAIALASVGLLGTSLVQCSADSGSSGSNTGGSGNTGGSSSGGSGATVGFDGSIVPDVATKDYSAEDFFVDDPPPQGCDGGGKPVVPGGTPECPDDKNLQGCPCVNEGEQKPCWPGYRKHRNKGNCTDGVTTCQKVGEIALQWGECKGYQGIDPNTFMPLGTTGKAACTCFSGGFWKLQNTSPCFSFTDQSFTTVLGAVSTIMNGNQAQCPDTSTIDWNNPQPPAQPFSQNWVTADCTGFFKLCYTFKALSAPNAARSATDCVMKQVCTEAYYSTANQEQAFPDLPSWVTQSPVEKSCAQSFVSNGGYAEMSVVGESDECDKLDKVFQTVNYCPLKCNPTGGGAACGDKTCGAGENATNCASDCDPVCANCTNGGGGPF